MQLFHGNLIESLKNQNYNKDLYDIYEIADNCTDNTARVAKKAGAIVYERFDNTKKTKGYALDWFLQQKICALSNRILRILLLPSCLLDSNKAGHKEADGQ